MPIVSLRLHEMSNLFSDKNKKSIIDLSSAEFTQILMKLKANWKEFYILKG